MMPSEEIQALWTRLNVHGLVTEGSGLRSQFVRDYKHFFVTACGVVREALSIGFRLMCIMKEKDRSLFTAFRRQVEKQNRSCMELSKKATTDLKEKSFVVAERYGQ
jgi:hypothetical protein